jgi:hypothetical protein
MYNIETILGNGLWINKISGWKKEQWVLWDRERTGIIKKMFKT